MNQPNKPTAQLAPYSQEAEEAVLGAILVNPDGLLEVAPFLETEDFYLIRHAYIYDACKRLNNRDEQIDFVTVQNELRVMNRLDDIGGAAYLIHLSNSTPTSVHARVYGELVHRAALRRRLLIAADEIKALAMDEEAPMEKIGVEAWARLERVNVTGAREKYMPGSRSIQHYDDVITERAKRRENGERVSVPMPERWSRLTERLPALYFGDFVVISGASGSGKSAFAEAFSEHCAMLGLATDYIHTEMSTEEVLDRRMARHSGVAFHRLAGGDLNPVGDYHPYSKMLEADNAIAKWVGNIAYHWMPDVKFERLAMHLKRAAMMGVKVFCIDHFQDIVPPVPKGGNEVRAFEAMCVWLNAFAEMRQVLVIVASQLNDQGKVKWSRKLVEKADVWLTIKRDRLKQDFAYQLGGIEYQATAGEDSPKTELYIGKARFGKKAKVPMLYHGPSFQWHDLSAIRERTAGQNVVSLEELQAQQRTGNGG